MRRSQDLRAWAVSRRAGAHVIDGIYDALALRAGGAAVSHGRSRFRAYQHLPVSGYWY